MGVSISVLMSLVAIVALFSASKETCSISLWITAPQAPLGP